MKNYALSCIAVLLSIGMTSCGNYTNFSGEPNRVKSLDATPVIFEDEIPALELLRIVPDEALVPIGSITPYKSIAVYSDGQERDVSNVSTWFISDVALAKVGKDDGNVKVFAESIGATTVHAAFEGIEASALLTIVDTPPQNVEITSIKVVPHDALIPAGTTLQFKAFAVLSNGSEIEITSDSEWMSNDINIVTLNPTVKGLATGISVGETMIVATYKNMAGSTNVQTKEANLLSLTVTPASIVLYNGELQTYTATGTYSDGSVRDVSAIALWQSANTVIGEFTSAGIGNIFLAKNVGNTTVTASIGTISGNASVAVRVIPGVPVQRFGINFEDLDALVHKDVVGGLGDKLVDHNDFVLCFDGQARVENQVITSLEDQVINFFTSHDSVCAHTATVDIYQEDNMGNISILQQFVFSTPTEPKYQAISFPKFAKIRAKIDIVNQFDCTKDMPDSMVTWESADAAQTEIISNTCRFKNPITLPPLPAP